MSGTLEGALGAAVVEGSLDGEKLSASVRRKDPTDRGFTGTLVGQISGSHGLATLTVTSADATSIRTGTCEIGPSPGR